ncbi:hypothetical protein [Brumimicrobium oceani]|nr:hypothetical protein [Brumimicrobium oceani]
MTQSVELSLPNVVRRGAEVRREKKNYAKIRRGAEIRREEEKLRRALH